ncbi:MAG: BrnT family toxin [Sphingomonadales bacterium]|nr:BrnT family toxin [Sphingomonadales bacterium]
MSDAPDFIWDEAKRLANIAKHGLDFAEAGAIDWDLALQTEDRFAEGEYRWLATAPMGRVLVSLVATDRDGTLRLISLRTATAQEIRMWREAFYD